MIFTPRSFSAGLQSEHGRSQRDFELTPRYRFDGAYQERITMSKQDYAQHKFTNRLIEETSPYLLQHAHNPVDWYAWEEGL